MEKSAPSQSKDSDYIWSLGVVATCSLISEIMNMLHVHRMNLITIYLAGVVLVAARYTRTVTLLTSLLSIAAFDLLFVFPNGPREREPSEYLISLAVFAFVAILVNEMAAQIRKQAEATQKAKLLVETERMRNALLSTVSHDLRTPLSAIVGASSSLLESKGELTSETVRELASSIFEEADRLNRLLKNLLDMTRIEGGAIEVKKEWHSLEEVVGVALAQLDRRLAGHRVRIDLPADLPLIGLDEILIEQVLINLIDNAIKYTQAEAEILISAARAEKGVTVEVANDGPQLMPGDENRIFEKFYRGTTGSKASGTGLGLAICKAIIESHKGKIWAYNREPAGVGFKFTLPLNEDAPKVNPEDEVMAVAGLD